MTDKPTKKTEAIVLTKNEKEKIIKKYMKIQKLDLVMTRILINKLKQ